MTHADRISFPRPGAQASTAAGVLLWHVDLRQRLPALDAPDGRTHRVYLWWRSRPLGVLHLEAWQLPVTRERMARLVAGAIAPAVGDLLYCGSPFTATLPHDAAPASGDVAALADVLDPAVLERLEAAVAQEPVQPADVRTAAVVVCTRNRPEQLRRCLRALAALDRRPNELVVVDNAPLDDATRRVVEQEGATYVLEPRPGLSRARNAGIAATTSDVVAFTDDDVTVHSGWMSRLLSGFDAPDVMSVTGLVLPASLESAAERAFEDRIGGFGQGFRRRVFDQEWLLRHRRQAPHVWQVGAGASVAFRRAAFDRVGGFDVELGAGAAGCSEDSELWHRLLAGGWRIRYEPGAVVDHWHRGTVDGLQEQARAYLQGHVAALAVQWTRTRQVGELRRALLSLPTYFARRAATAAFWGEGDATLRAEVRGYISGLAAAVPLLRARPPVLPVEDVGEAGPSTKSPLRAFLRTNPFPHTWTLGLFYREKMRAIHGLSPASGVAVIVEVGGGQSGLAAALYPSATVVTVDLDETFGSRTDLYGQPRRGFVCGDATRLPVRDGAADVVTLFDVLEHIPDDSAAVREALRILRPGGHILLTTPSSQWRFPYYRAYRSWTPSDHDVMDDWGHVRRGYRVSDLDRIAGRAHDALSTFISPVTVLAHDVAFSNLPPRAKRLAGLLLAPVVVPAARLHAAHGPGTEVALRWTVP